MVSKAGRKSQQGSCNSNATYRVVFKQEILKQLEEVVYGVRLEAAVGISHQGVASRNDSYSSSTACTVVHVPATGGFHVNSLFLESKCPPSLNGIHGDLESRHEGVTRLSSQDCTTKKAHHQQDPNHVTLQLRSKVMQKVGDDCGGRG